MSDEEATAGETTADNPSAEEWIERFAREVGVEPPDERQLGRLLNLASVAAHSSERRAAPIACWILGASGRSVDEAIEIAERI